MNIASPAVSDTGLVYMQSRYYDPVIGRFLSTDPVTFSPDKPNHFNRYWYANGNPYGFTDPDGRIPLGLLYAPSKEFQKKMAARSLAATSIVTGTAASVAPKTTPHAFGATLVLSGVSATTGFAAGQLDGESMEFGATMVGFDVATEALDAAPHPAAKFASFTLDVSSTSMEGADLSLSLFQDTVCQNGSECEGLGGLSNILDSALFGDDQNEVPSVAEELNKLQETDQAMDMN